jgi:hypothetical protein
LSVVTKIVKEAKLDPTHFSPRKIDQRISQLKVVLDYLSKTVPGVRRLEGVRDDAPAMNAGEVREGIAGPA